MKKTKRVFISDLHLSSKELYESGHSWYDPATDGARLEAFIDRSVLSRADDIKDFVLLGDVFNTWVVPHDKPPPAYEDILEDNELFLRKMKDITEAGIKIFYVRGNHDFDVDKHYIEAAVPGLTVISHYRTGRVHAEHGHHYDIYNKPDFISDPAFGRPIGYPISRLATTARREDFGILDLPGFLDDILEAALTSQNIFESIVEAMAERAGLTDEDVILMPDGRETRIREVKERYSRLAGVYSLTELASDLYQRRYLHGPADRLCARNQYNVVVFGHTHNALLDKDWFLVEDRIYANTGSICKEKAYCVEVDKSRELGEPTRVRLLKIRRDGTTKKVEAEEVD